MSALRLRVLTGLATGGLAIAAIWFLSPPWMVAILSLAVLMGAWEWSAFLRARGVALRAAYVALIALAGIAGWHLTRTPAAFLVLMWLSLAWWLLALAWLIALPQRTHVAGAALAGFAALVPAWIALVRIDSRWHDGPQWTLFILVLAFAADTGAFFTGRHFGRIRLAPRVSPNKTWEGVAGGMALAVLISIACLIWSRLPAARFLALGAVAAAFSVVGDLTESLFKRHAGLKDSGRLFPGHGGVLDRIDSVTAAAPIMTLGLIWLGVGA